MRGFKW